MDHSLRPLLQRAVEAAITYRAALPERPVDPRADASALLRLLGDELPEDGLSAEEALQALIEVASPGLVGSAGPRYFGHVIGGSYPVSVAADWLTSAWDQNAALFDTSPASAVIEAIVADWLTAVLRLDTPGRPVSCGFVSGGTMANLVGVAAARHRLLSRASWNVEERGLFGAPEISVVAGEEAHGALLSALQLLGLGRGRVKRVAVDKQGRMRPEALRTTLSTLNGPVLVCAQAGNVHSGAFDPIGEIAAACAGTNSWIHVDGAFGLWAAASPRLSHHLKGHELADSWAVDAHKVLNVPYDSGLAFVADPQAHRAAMSLEGQAYLQTSRPERRQPHHWVPELSRRARVFPLYATLVHLGRKGILDLVERLHHLAQLMAQRLGSEPEITVLNDVSFNQVTVQFEPRSQQEDPSALAQRVAEAVQQEGVCWVGTSKWQGRAVLRVCVCNWSTTEADIDRSARAILESLRNASDKVSQ